MVFEMITRMNTVCCMVETNKNGTYGSQFHKKPDQLEVTEQMELNLRR